MSTAMDVTPILKERYSTKNKFKEKLKKLVK